MVVVIVRPFVYDRSCVSSDLRGYDDHPHVLPCPVKKGVSRITNCKCRAVAPTHTTHIVRLKNQRLLSEIKFV